MSRLGYPTHGAIRYDYFRQTMPGAKPCPSDDWLDDFDLLLSKRILDEDGVRPPTEPEWSYAYALSNYDYDPPVFPNACTNDPSSPQRAVDGRRDHSD